MLPRPLKSRVSIWFAMLSLFVLSNCVEPIDFEFDLPPDDLVVDGYITDVAKRHLIRLSLSSRLEENVPIKRPVVFATVELVDDQGNSISLENTGNGDFLTPNMRANPDRGYKVVVNYNGQTHESSFEQLPTPAFAPELSLRVDREDRREVLQGTLIVPRTGTSIHAQLQKTNRTVYYQWYLNRCNSSLVGGLSPEGRYCSVFNNLGKPTIKIFRDGYQSDQEGQLYETELAWINKQIEAVPGDIMEIDQFLISRKAHDYWEDIQQSFENEGSIFDATPARIVGNIRNIESKKVTLGFFGVYRQTSWERVSIY